MKSKQDNIMRLIGIAASALSGAAVILWIRRMGIGLIYAYAGLSLLFLARVMEIAIHELGHLAGGSMSGYRFVCIEVAGFTVSRAESGRLRIGRMNIPGADGHCLMEPPELKDGKMPYKRLGAGGILANLIAAAAFCAAALLADGPTSRMIFTVFAIWNAAGVLISGIPCRGYVDNDAQNLLEMSRSEEAVRKYRQGMMMSVMKFRGVSLKDMPEEWFYLPADEELHSSTFAVDDAFQYYYRLAELERDEEAEQLADRLLAEGIPLNDGQRATLRINRAIAEMKKGIKTQEECLKISEQWLDEPTKRYISALGRSLNGLRVQYALAMLVKGHVYKARQLEEDYNEAVRKHPTVRDQERDKKFFREVREAYERRKTEEIHK